MKRFSSLLATTCVSCESILHESTSAVPVLFASKVLSIASLLLPSVRRLLFAGMEKLFPSSSINIPDLTQDLFADFKKPTLKSAEHCESSIPRSHSLLELPNPSLRPSALSTRSQGSLSVASESELFPQEKEEDDWEFPTNSTYDLDVSQEIVIPSSATPTPSPAPQIQKSEFSPIPSKSPPPPEDEDLSVDAMKLEVLASSMRVKDYTVVSDGMCIRRLREEKVREEYTEAVKALPTLFQWSEVMGEEVVEGLSDSEWWNERLV